MLSNVRKLFKKGASSPSSKDRPSSLCTSTENSASKERELSFESVSSSRGRTGKDGSAHGESDIYSAGGNPSSNGHSSNGNLVASSAVTGFDGAYLLLDRSKPSSPAHTVMKKQNGRPVTDPKVLQLLGASEDDEDFIAEWMLQSSPREDGSSDFSIPHNTSDESESSQDIAGVSWPQKSELPSSFEFALPAGKHLDGGRPLAEGFPYPDTGTSSSLDRPKLDLLQPLRLDRAGRVYAEGNYMENGIGTPSGSGSSVDSLDTLSRATRTILPVHSSRPSSPRLSNGHTSPISPSSPRLSNGHISPLGPSSPRLSTGHTSILCLSSPRGPSRSSEGRSYGSNGTHPEAMAWESTVSLSPKWAYNGQPSPEGVNRNLHPLPAPPQNPSAQPQVYGHPNSNLAVGSMTSNATRESQFQQTLTHRAQSPSRDRGLPRLTAHPLPVVSLLFPSPRSPLLSPGRPSFPAAPWAPLPIPPILSPCHSPPRSPPRVPKTLQRWQKMKQIGTGSFGTVHEALNLDDGSFFAVKISHGDSIPSELIKEIEVLSTLRHPNVVQYFGTAMENGHLCIFLELMQTSLQSIIKVFHPFNEALISTYTRQILQGLEYLHRKNTIHRDIKCANILVDKDGQVKLADFGLAKEVSMSLATSCKGTPYFMAPEILKSTLCAPRGYGLPVDIWSLGCTVIEMADGKPPWSFLQGYSFFFKLNKGELPPIPEYLSSTCKDFITKCLQFRPEDRPTASQLLLHPFVANAPATAAAAASVSPSPAAVLTGSAQIDVFHGRNGEMSHQSREVLVTSDVRMSDSQHQRPTLQRSPRLDRSRDPQTDAQQFQENLHILPRSPRSGALASCESGFSDSGNVTRKVWRGVKGGFFSAGKSEGFDEAYQFKCIESSRFVLCCPCFRSIQLDPHINMSLAVNTPSSCPSFVCCFIDMLLGRSPCPK